MSFASTHIRSLWLAVLFSTCVGVTHAAAQQPTAPVKEVTVWVNSSSRVYHCPGTRYYGTTARGKYLTESAARSGGNRPAYGKACGTVVNSTQPTRLATEFRGSQTKVWVNSSSSVYHCPGTRYYGNTKRGAYMTEAEARTAGNRAAYGRTC